MRTETAAVGALWSRAWPDAGSDDVVIDIGDVGCPPMRDVEQRIGGRGHEGQTSVLDVVGAGVVVGATAAVCAEGTA